MISCRTAMRSHGHWNRSHVPVYKCWHMRMKTQNHKPEITGTCYFSSSWRVNLLHKIIFSLSVRMVHVFICQCKTWNQKKLRWDEKCNEKSHFSIYYDFYFVAEPKICHAFLANSLSFKKKPKTSILHFKPATYSKPSWDSEAFTTAAIPSGTEQTKSFSAVIFAPFFLKIHLRVLYNYGVLTFSLKILSTSSVWDGPGLQEGWSSTCTLFFLSVHCLFGE